MTTIVMPFTGRTAEFTGWRAFLAPWVVFSELFLVLAVLAAVKVRPYVRADVDVD